MQDFFRMACSRHIVHNALRIALVVGSLLNALNQGEALLAGSGIAWVHIAMNFVVPYCVATYSVTKHALATRTRP